jgi:hypothetical protein
MGAPRGSCARARGTAGACPLARPAPRGLVRSRDRHRGGSSVRASGTAGGRPFARAAPRGRAPRESGRRFVVIRAPFAAASPEVTGVCQEMHAYGAFPGPPPWARSRSGWNVTQVRQRAPKARRIATRHAARRGPPGCAMKPAHIAGFLDHPPRARSRSGGNVTQMRRRAPEVAPPAPVSQRTGVPSLPRCPGREAPRRPGTTAAPAQAGVWRHARAATSLRSLSPSVPWPRSAASAVDVCRSRRGRSRRRRLCGGRLGPRMAHAHEQHGRDDRAQ